MKLWNWWVNTRPGDYLWHTAFGIRHRWWDMLCTTRYGRRYSVSEIGSPRANQCPSCLEMNGLLKQCENRIQALEAERSLSRGCTPNGILHERRAGERANSNCHRVFSESGIVDYTRRSTDDKDYTGLKPRKRPYTVATICVLK